MLLRPNIFSFDYDFIAMLHSGIAGQHSTARERDRRPPARLLNVEIAASTSIFVRCCLRLGRPLLAPEARLPAPSKSVNTPARHVLLHSLAPGTHPGRTRETVADRLPASRGRKPSHNHHPRTHRSSCDRPRRNRCRGDRGTQRRRRRGSRFAITGHEASIAPGPTRRSRDPRRSPDPHAALLGPAALPRPRIAPGPPASLPGPPRRSRGPASPPAALASKLTTRRPAARFICSR